MFNSSEKGYTVQLLQLEGLPDKVLICRMERYFGFQDYSLITEMVI